MLSSSSVVDLSTAEAQKAAFSVYCNIAERWGLSIEERAIVLGLRPAEFDELQAGVQLDASRSEDWRTRLSHVLWIYEGLSVLLPDRVRADKWMSLPNAASPFGGLSARALLATGRIEDLAAVRDYLTACACM